MGRAGRAMPGRACEACGYETAPLRSATYPRESVLPIRLRPDFSVVFAPGEAFSGSRSRRRPRWGKGCRQRTPHIKRARSPPRRP